MKIEAFLAILALPSLAAAGVQPVIDFRITRPLPGEEGKPAPRLPAGHLADELAWTGGPSREFTENGLHFKPGPGPSGAIISMAGPAREVRRTRDFGDFRGFHGPAAPPAVVKGLIVEASGQGTLELSLLDGAGEPLWHSTMKAESGVAGPLELPLNGCDLGHVKSLAFSALAGADLDLKSVSLRLGDEEPDPAKRLFLASLAKLHRCYDPESGLTGDRAQVPSGAFIALPSSGMHALAIAAASCEGVYDPVLAKSEVAKTVRAMMSIPTAKGLLPHFAMLAKEGKLSGTPSSEYSVIDTALTLQSLLLATRVLAMDEETRQIGQAIQGIEWSEMIGAEGFVGHGYAPDGHTVLQGAYRGWGGEAALSLLLEAMGRGPAACGKMRTSGKPFQGRGFIAELQSLFHPDFDRDEKDIVSGVSWLEARRALMREQASYFTSHLPDSAAAREGLWGLSAGESGLPGGKYGAFGSEEPGHHWIHPHYQVMATCMLDRGGIGKMVASYERAGLLFPLGLPEGIDADCIRYNPMDGSLNASFEALAAYHGWKGRGQGNAIDRASMADPMIRAAMRRFYTEP